MPHLGRISPFHPTYWATLGWFWPGFVPWKLFVSLGFNLNPPWNRLPDFEEFVTDEGFHDDLPLSMNWVGYPDFRSEGAGAALIVFDTESAPPHNCRVFFELYDDTGTLVADATSILSRPQRTSTVNTWTVAHEYPSGAECILPDMLIRGATYDEGGSPFPFPTGGHNPWPPGP